ncbi:Sulfotransfer_1 domain-containing protein [Vibrio chagasii]|uniref:sulfotransferase family protein n=1 Tax=Vibrio chagasii TaxID=170679 RepID=UPI001EFC4A92|nr:sulfotransferase [Vibrio chagasii]MCG9674521.1 sulfotransferase [Vibrio chagasii]CAH6900314.1 Sulfotransfer_1 domain-containing protein [Vibrio chagasii]CAH6907126.1 Sulfotransfer_1 domain-containing protein [Vibrio chagasii]CAH6929834.1 Sulfotransfer_1 domain-containing protein [Vibrio chagasii]CAH7041572.1 Sulfotransfer_1 domain-containing protein [Vibrio chagasii]
MNQFFIVGAQRSSTTWLYKMLNQHPEVKMAEPVRPEPKYFLSKNFDNKKDNYIKNYFYDIKGGITACGEKSTSYIEYELAAKRISSMFPDAKIIMMLRNPIKRAISNYQFSFNNGLETRTISEAILGKKPSPKLNSPISTDPFDYLNRGLYQNYIDMYEKYFSRSNILLLSTENITNNVEILQKAYKFLGVNDQFFPSEFNDYENASQEKINVPKEVIEYLEHYYKKTNEYLSQHPSFNR